MPYIVALALVFVALALGLLANSRWLHLSKEEAGDQSLSLNDLVTPVTTLAVVLLAFIMVEALSSFGRARSLIGEEARILDQMAEEALLLESRDATMALQGDLICYARAVRYKEWPAMVDGNRAPEVAVWTTALRNRLTMIGKAGDDEVEYVDRLLERDGERGRARLARLTESTSTIPTGLNWLMLGSVVLSIFGLAFFMHPHGNRHLNVVVLVAFATLTAASLWMIDDLDKPFNGLNELTPAEIARVQQGMEDELSQLAPNFTLPCDDQGAASARPS